MTKFSLNSSNLFVVCSTADALTVWDTGSNLNSSPFDPPPSSWKLAATVRSKPPAAAYVELEVNGTVLSGAALQKLIDNIYELQLFVNRDGYSLVYFNNDGSKGFGESNMWKLNDIYEWSYLGVKQESTLLWDRCRMDGTGVRIGYKSEMAKKDGEIDRLKKQMVEFAARESKTKEITSVTYREIERMKSTNVVNMKAKEDEIQKLKSSNVVNINAKNGEIQQLKSSYEEKMKAKDEEIQKLNKSTIGQDPDGIVGALRMEMAELKFLLDDASKENEELKAATAAN